MIKDPKYKNGKMLPKEIEMAKRWGISRNTIRQATAKLIYEELLIRKKGRGNNGIEKVHQNKVEQMVQFQSGNGGQRD